MATYTVGGRGARSASMSTFKMDTTNKNSLMNRILQGGMGSLTSGEQATARSLMSPEEMASVTGRSLGSGTGTSSGGSGGAGGGTGGNLDAGSLLELYQKGLGAAGGAQSVDDQLKLLREGNKIDMESRKQQQQLQMQGQEETLEKTQQARAKERETEAILQQRQQSTERNNAMSAYRGL